MSTTKRSLGKWLAPLLLVLVAAAIFIGYRKQSTTPKGDVFIEVRSIRSGQGWGYDILTDGKIYIHQEFIPALQGRRPFRTEEDALKVGRKVISKLSLKEIPTITMDELREMGIANDSLVLSR
jgi:Domain of unknown function (DUF4907)